MSNTILLDRAAKLTISAGVLRVTCNAIGGDGQEYESGVLLIPGATAGPVINALVLAMKDLAEQQHAQAGEPAGNA